MLLLRTPRFRLPHCQKTPSFRLKYLPISSLSSTYRSPTEFHQIPCKSNGFRKSFSVFTPLFQLHKPGKSDLNKSEVPKEPTQPLKNTIYTIPNLLTVSRIFSCPILGYAILQDNFYLATSLLVYAGLTDLADGYLARKFQMSSVLGTILDPAADKALMTTLVVTLTMRNMVPLPLGIIIISRDVILTLWAFYIRYTSLPPPKTFQRYWDFSIFSAEVRPTNISKVNTALQLLLMGVTTISPLLSTDISIPLQALQWTVAATTLWSGFSYLFAKDGFKVIKAASSSNNNNRNVPPPPPSTS